MYVIIYFELQASFFIIKNLIVFSYKTKVKDRQRLKINLQLQSYLSNNKHNFCN